MFLDLVHFLFGTTFQKPLRFSATRKDGVNGLSPPIPPTIFHFSFSLSQQLAAKRFKGYLPTHVQDEFFLCGHFLQSGPLNCVHKLNVSGFEVRIEKLKNVYL